MRAPRRQRSDAADVGGALDEKIIFRQSIFISPQCSTTVGAHHGESNAFSENQFKNIFSQKN
jgi:hypothetical protein